MLDPALRERVDRVKAANRIEVVAAELGLSLKKKGRSLFFRCINPAHEDSDPSCSISTQKQGYHCFGGASFCPVCGGKKKYLRS